MVRFLHILEEQTQKKNLLPKTKFKMTAKFKMATKTKFARWPPKLDLLLKSTNRLFYQRFFFA
jgi:hypothetical protein